MGACVFAGCSSAVKKVVEKIDGVTECNADHDGSACAMDCACACMHGGPAPLRRLVGRPPRATQATLVPACANRHVKMLRHSQAIAVDTNADKVTVQLDNAEELKPKVVEVRATLCSFARPPHGWSAPRAWSSVKCACGRQAIKKAGFEVVE